ncbi:hypothetical protein DFS33DRAFT_1272397 [Desarmillaria ectypa]|nr:hypothetical protein DFS33DRAFT_1272397 [Desarmillaria ectypa]
MGRESTDDGESIPHQDLIYWRYSKGLTRDLEEVDGKLFKADQSATTGRSLMDEDVKTLDWSSSYKVLLSKQRKMDRYQNKSSYHKEPSHFDTALTIIFDHILCRSTVPTTADEAPKEGNIPVPTFLFEIPSYANDNVNARREYSTPSLWIAVLPLIRHRLVILMRALMKALRKFTEYERKPLACSSCVSNPIMTVRYSEQVLPGCVRFYDDALNPQIDSFDYVYAESSKAKLSQQYPAGRIQPQRRLSADVDMCDFRPPLLPRRPTYNLERPRIEVRRPITILPNPYAPLPISLPSSSRQSLPPRQILERGLPPSIVSLHGPRPLTVENLAQFNMQQHLQPVPPHLLGQHALISRAQPPSRRTHALPSFPPSVRQQRQPQRIPISLMSNPWIRSIITTIRSSCAQLLVRERQEKEEIRKELHELRRSVKRPLREGRSPYSRESSSSRASDELQYPASTPKRRRLSVSSEDGVKPVLQVFDTELQNSAAVLVPLVEDVMEPRVKEERVEVRIAEMKVVKAIKEEEVSVPLASSYLPVPGSLPVIVPWTQYDIDDGMGECDMDLESDGEPDLEEGEIYEDHPFVSPSPSTSTDSSGVTLVETVENKWLNMVVIR